MKKKKLPKNKTIDSTVLLEHFLGGGLISIRPLTLTGFENRSKIKEQEEKVNYYKDKDGITKEVPDGMWFDDEKNILKPIPSTKGAGNLLTKHFSLTKSTVEAEYNPGGVVDVRTKEESAAIPLIFSTYMIFSPEILQGMRENYSEEQYDWWKDDAREMKKSMQVNERALNAEIAKLQSSGLLEPSYFIGIGGTPQSHESGILVPPQVKDFIIYKVRTAVSENFIKKPLAFDYIMEVTLESTKKQGLREEEFMKIAKNYATYLEKIIFQEKTYYTFEMTPPADARRVNTKNPKIPVDPDEQ